MLHNGGNDNRRVVVVDVYNDANNSSETTTVSRKINEEQRESRQKINGSALYNSTSSSSLSRKNLGSAETVKINGHHSENSVQSDFVTVLRVDDTPEEALQKAKRDRRIEERITTDSQSFVTILQVNEMMRTNGQVVTTNGTSETRQVMETVIVYRLPGERLGMALKFEGGDANTSAPVSKVLIQSIQPDSPAARAESEGTLLGRLQEGDTILDIDGREVTSLTRLDCVSLLRDASVCIKLKVQREMRTNGLCEETYREETDERPKLPAKKKSGPPPIPPRKTACLSHSPTLGNSFAKSFEKDFASIEGVKEKIQRLECVQSTIVSSCTEKVLRRPSHPPPLPPRRPRSGSESTSDTEDPEKTPTFPGGSLSMRLPGWDELMQRRAERFVESQCNHLPMQPNIYMDLFAEEEDKRGIESESDDTGSSVSTVIEKFSRGSTANSSFSEIHHGTTPHFDLKQVLSPFEQLERELDEAAQNIREDSFNDKTQATDKVLATTDITILPPESFQDGALNLLDSNSYYKVASSPISPPGDSGFDDEEEPEIKFSNNSEISNIENQEFDNEKDNEVFVDNPNDILQNNLKDNQSIEDENEQFVDEPVETQNVDLKTKPVDLPPAVPQKREVPKPPPVPPRLSIPKSPKGLKEDIIPPKIPDSKERPRSAKVIPTSLLEPTVIGAIEKKQPTLNQSPDRSSKATFKETNSKTTETVKMRSKSGGHAKDNSSRRPKSLILTDTSKSYSENGFQEHTVRRPRSLSLEDAEGTLMTRLREISSPAFPSKIPRPTFLTSPITSLDRGHFTFGSSSASVSRSNSMSSIDREPTSLPCNLNGDRGGVLLSRSESLRSTSVDAKESTVTRVVKGKDGVQIQQNTVIDCKGSETRTTRAVSSRFGYVEKTEGRRVNASSRSATTVSRQKSSDGKEIPSKKKLVRSHSAQGELYHRGRDEVTDGAKNKREQETRAKENVKSSPEPLKLISTDSKSKLLESKMESDSKQREESKNHSTVESSHFDVQDEVKNGKELTTDDTSQAIEESKPQEKVEHYSDSLKKSEIVQDQAKMEMEPKGNETPVDGPNDVTPDIVKEDVDDLVECSPEDHRLVREFYESTVEVINPAFEEPWLADTFQLSRQTEEQREILLLDPSDSESPPGSFTLLDEVLRTEGEPLQFRVEVGLPEDHTCRNELIELQPGQTNIAFFNQTTVSGDPFAGDKSCKNAFAWNLSRWPLHDVPEEEEPVEEETEESRVETNKQKKNSHPDGDSGEIERETQVSAEIIKEDQDQPDRTNNQAIEADELTSEHERPVAEGSSPPSSDNPSLELNQTEVVENQTLNTAELESRIEKKIGKPLGDEMDIYFSGPPAYGVNQHQVQEINYRELKTSPPPPPTYSRAPPDGHEFPPNYSEPEVPPAPSSLPPKMPVIGEKIFGEKATLVKESSTTSLSRSFSLSSPPEYMIPNRHASFEDGNSYKDTVAFHNQRNQENPTVSPAIPGRLLNGNGNRWNSEECLSKNVKTTSRSFLRRESEKPASVRDRIAQFSKPDVPAKQTANPQTITYATPSTTKTINLATPKREVATSRLEEHRGPNLTNGESKLTDSIMDDEMTYKSAMVMEATTVRNKTEDTPRKNQENGQSQPALVRRESCSPYISNYPQTQLSRMRYSYGGQKGEEIGRRSSLGAYPPPYLESRRQSATKLKGLVIPDKANFVPKTENRLPTIIRSSTASPPTFANSFEKPVTSLSSANTFQAKSDSVVETAKPSMAISLDSKSNGTAQPPWKQPRVSKLQKEQAHQPAFKSHSLDFPKTTLSASSVAATVSSSSLSSLASSSITLNNATKQSTFQFSLSHSKPVTPTLPEKPILVSPTPPVTSSPVEAKPATVFNPEMVPPPLPASRPPTALLNDSVKDINQNSLPLSNNKSENQIYSYKETTNGELPKTNPTIAKRSALDRLDSLVLTNSNKTNEEAKFETTDNNKNSNANLNNNLNARHQTYVEQVITRDDILAITSNSGAVTPDFMSCGSSVFSNSSTNDSRLWSIRPSESDDDTNSVISLRTEDSRQTADDSMSDTTTDSMDRLNSDLKPRRLSQQKTVLRARMDSADSVKNFRALAERWEMRAGDSTPESSARSTPSGPPPAPSLPLGRKDSGKPTSPITEINLKLPPSLLPRNGSETIEGKDKPTSPTRQTRESRSFSVTNDSWSGTTIKDRVETSLNEKNNRRLSSLDRSASSYTLDLSGVDTALECANKVNRAVSYAGIGKSSRSISVSDIRKTFESQLKTESPVTPKIAEPDIMDRNVAKRESVGNHSPGNITSYAYTKELRTSSTLLPTTTEIHHKRFSSMDSTASDSGVSTPAHYGSTSSLAAPSSGSREHFGSVTSLASTSSLISPQELQQLIDEANQSLNEELSSSGGSAGHEISVVVLHKDTLTGSVGITLAGGADYETKEITIHKVINGSLADRDDRLRKGDRIVSINGKNLRGVSHREALEILKSPRQEVVLVISRERAVPESQTSTLSSTKESVKHLTNETSTRVDGALSSPSNLQPRLSDSSSTVEKTITPARESGATESSVSQKVAGVTSGSHVIIQLIKDGTGLGFSLEGGKDSPFGDKPLIVKRVFKGGAADREGSLKSADEIVSVNHQSVSNMTRTEAWNFMKKLPDGPVSIVVRKG